ncbi:peptide/nickel transport system permease protein [Rhodococcus rhodochrous J3]|uniref:Peptide/nickel transport system permease protein n=3 Tax=Rhodococcus rhodochrous TaxID=1829 RepID=A0A562E8G2_RHORH|nr:MULTISPECIES: ABC transporter permease [Rhodococcus]MBF4478649.1 ABC transporter permease [Rhodococcus rhodochrous]MCB8913481.1 ABC transporter permease [Rhodococcus rhodochrous]MCD2099908.1 ABC transporter permease [Rhodococcus rhodochrous]MCD2124318.1 ABC transporter permease [Rhodococcus rhodochrous]MCK8672070.1 ABC transporter permease [Rhodococcus sp. HM1]
MTTTVTNAKSAKTLFSYTPGRTMKRLMQDRVGMFCLAGLMFLVFIGVLAQFWTPKDPSAQSLLNRLESPSSEYWLGTDAVGRDILSRLMVATGVDLAAAALAVGIGIVVGASLGLMAGYLGGVLDSFTSRVSDVLLSLPPLLFAVAIVGALGPSLTNAMIAIGVLLAPRFFRLVRVSTREIINEDYVEAARSGGAGPIRIMARHVAPNIVSPLLIQISFGASVAIVAESGLSFLGLGVQPPTASWGSMVKEGFDNLAINGWTIIPSSVVIVVSILMLSLFGDSLRDAVGSQGGSKA